MEKKILSSANNTKLTNIMRIIIITALSIVLFYPPYLQGLFFEKHQLPTEIFVFALFIFFWIYKWVKRDHTFLKTPIEYVSIAFIAVYLISIIVAVHTRSAIAEVLKYCMYFAVFYMVTEMAENIKVKTIFLWTILLSAVGVSIIGLNSAMGGTLVSVFNKFFSKLGVEGDLFFGLFVDARINSTLQYPNALASYVMAVFFIVIGLLLSESKIWLKVLYGACAYILLLTFMLTKSRGAQLLFPVAILVFLLVSPKKTKIKSVFHSLFLAIPAIAVSLVILPYLSENEVNRKAVLLFAAGMLVTVLFSMIAEQIGNLLQKVNKLVYIGIITVLVIAMPLVVYRAVNASVPLELIHNSEEENSSKYISRDVSLTPGEYILRFDAQAKAEKEQPYVFNVSISAKTEDDILFGGSTVIANKTFKEPSELRQESIPFIVPTDSNLITVNFVNYYSGTGVILNNAEVIDSISGNVVQKVVIKNKYNLESLITRFQNIGQEKSGIVRILFYKDGLKIFKDRWLIGGGGGAWEYLYRQYQSYSYPSTQAHNFPLQLGIETGILGLLVLIALLFYLVFGYFRYTKKIQDKPSSELFTNTAIITAMASLFMHAVIDFDFSESAMLLLFWQLIALFNRETRDCQVFTNHTSKKKEPLQGKLKLNILGGIVAGAIVLGLSISFYSASVYAKEAFNQIQQSETEKAIENINRAIRMDKFNEKYILGYNPIPTRPDIKSGLADILLIKASLLQQQQNNGKEIPQTELEKLQRQFADLNQQIELIAKNASYNLILTTNLAGYNFQTGDYIKGLDYLNHAIQLSPFEPSLWYAKINVYFELTRTFFNKGEDENAEKYLSEGLKIIEEAKEINKNNMNPFVFNENSMELLQKMAYMKDHWVTDQLYRINEVIHYTIPSLDINLDNKPDQWRSGDIGLININVSEQGIQVVANGSSYITAQKKLLLEKGKTYLAKVKLDRPISSIAFDIAGLTDKTTLQVEDDNWYTAEVLIEKESKSDGNQMRIFLESDCVIESILLLDKTQ